MGGTVSSASLPLTKLPPVVAPVRACARFDVFHWDLLHYTMHMGTVRMTQVVITSWVCMRQQSTTEAGCIPHLSPGVWALARRRSDR